MTVTRQDHQCHDGSWGLSLVQSTMWSECLAPILFFFSFLRQSFTVRSWNSLTDQDGLELSDLLPLLGSKGMCHCHHHGLFPIMLKS